VLGVVSQHRFDDSTQFLKRAIDADRLGDAGRLGRILEADAYVKWFRPPEYYARLGKGTWAGEGGGVLINQGIHSVDLLLWMMGPVQYVDAQWQLGALHKIESEDVVNALIQYESGATGVIQASTAFRPGSPERIEIHGAKGTAIIAGDRLVTWEVEESLEPLGIDPRDHPPLQASGASGASDPMAISLTPFERQFRDFGDAIQGGHAPLVSGDEGYRALELVDAIYRSCREGRRILLGLAFTDHGAAHV
jgi:predicted dehydrogenase